MAAAGSNMKGKAGPSGVYSSEDNIQSSTQDDVRKSELNEELEKYERALANIENETLAKRFGFAKDFVD